MTTLDQQLAALVRDLPDPDGARRFYERLAAEHPRAVVRLRRDEALLSDALTLAAWSPLLATTMAQHPEHLTWLERERAGARVRTAEELGESLARFAHTHTQLPPEVLLARFRRRELLRIYLHDIRRTATVVETTEELSNLADAVLIYALGLARQELDNRHGVPLCTDRRGRTTTASFCVVALGKLGSRELNYASDIDLLFLYSDDGETSGAGERGATTNREYFNRLAEKTARLAGGQQAGEGAAYRVDLRLRPHGRDGALSCSLSEAARYYRETAQAWERQALIRARASAGAASLYARFADAVRAQVYAPDATVARALADVRLAKQKIDRQHGRDARGFNVKLGRGGIREIEFIAQALQLAHGGRDAWLQHAPHTLISLGRLADRALITERERAELSDAYHFLRHLEHRLQMEEGLQTHTVPEDSARRLVVARRMDCNGADADALSAFVRALELHTANVRRAFERVFRGAGEVSCEGAQEADVTSNDQARTDAVMPTLTSDTATDGAPSTATPEADALNAAPSAFRFTAITDAEASAALAAAAVFAPRFLSSTATLRGETARVEQLGARLRAWASASLNPRRALSLVARVAASLDKSPLLGVALTDDNVHALVRLCGASELFGEMLAGSPELISALADSDAAHAPERDFRSLLRAAVDGEQSFRAELAALRRAWSASMIEIGARDAAGRLSLADSNRLQTELATASVNVALLVARRELARRHERLDAGPRLAVFGLGRLGSGGMDYGSDLDLVVVYDARVPSPVGALTPDAANARLAELMTTALSSLTREGHLYRVDMRLRPDGRDGVLARNSQSFLDYLAARTEVWEWLAYVKLRAVAGDLELGRRLEAEARRLVHDAARRYDPEALRVETRHVRHRLEEERTSPRARDLDIKFGAGGMLDVYFASRYLQLRDNVPDQEPDRSTAATLARLRDAGCLDATDFRALADGYRFLRGLDHALRLTAARSARLPAALDHPLLQDLARATGHNSAAELITALAARQHDIRAAYERITT